MGMPAACRKVIANAALVVVMCLNFRGIALAASPQAQVQAPGFYRMRLGEFEITALSDGTHPFPDAEVLTQAVDGSSKRAKLFQAHPGEARSALAAVDLTAPTEGSINAFLVNTGKQLILVDSGAGSLYGVCCGHMLSNLKAAGYRPEQVDEILLTHLHADHVGGIAPNGIMAFPHAIVRASQVDADYWLDEAHEKAAPDFLGPMFRGAMASLKPYIAAKRFVPFSGDVEIEPGINAIAAPGHTPGHTLYRISSDGQTLLLWGDIVHVAPIQFNDPSITVEYDSDEKVAQATRLRIFALAASETDWIGAAHVSFPGLGHVGKRGSSFFWIPAEYTTRLAPPSH